MDWLRQRVRVDEATGCWVWRGTCNHKGYGRYHFTNGSGVHTGSAHRLALELKLGRPIRPGLHALHSCDNPPCCNGGHLREGTVSDNQQESFTKGRHPLLRGELAPMAKLTREDVAEILAALERGTYQRVIARQYGIDQAQVSRIKNGKAWL